MIKLGCCCTMYYTFPCQIYQRSHNILTGSSYSYDRHLSQTHQTPPYNQLIHLYHLSSPWHALPPQPSGNTLKKLQQIEKVISFNCQDINISEFSSNVTSHVALVITGAIIINSICLEYFSQWYESHPNYRTSQQSLKAAITLVWRKQKQ